MDTDILPRCPSYSADQPPAYESKSSVILDHLPSTFLFIGLTDTETKWVNELSSSPSEKRCSTCENENPPKSKVRQYISTVTFNLALHFKRFCRPQDFINLQSAAFIIDRKTVLAATRLRSCNVPEKAKEEKASRKLATAMPYYRFRDNFSHHSEVLIKNGRLMVKTQSYRGLETLSTAELRACLPTCVHCRGARPLAQQHQKCLTDLERGQRYSGGVFRCHGCPTEYVTMAVPRASCHLPGTEINKKTPEHLQVDRKYRGPDWTKQMILTFISWMDLGPWELALQTIDERCALTGPKTTTSYDMANPLCEVYEGGRIWPYSPHKAQSVLISKDTPEIRDTTIDVGRKPSERTIEQIQIPLRQQELE